MAPSSWRLVALAGVAAGAAFVLACTPIVREGVWLAMVSASFVATLVAVVRSQPGRRYPWILISVRQGLVVVANLLGNPGWATPASAAWSTPIAVLAFPFLALGALAFSRAQVPGGDRESVLDGGIVMVATAAVLAATAFNPGLLGNTFRAALVVNGAYERGTPTDLLVLATTVLIAMACLHPSAVKLTEPADPRRRQFTLARLTALGAALVAIPLTLLLRGGDRAPDPRPARGDGAPRGHRGAPRR